MLSLSPNHGYHSGLCSTYMLKMLLGVSGEREGRGTLISLLTSQIPLVCLPSRFSVATWVITKHWVALSTQHRTGEVHAGKGTRVRPREQGTRHPEEHANTEDPRRSKDATTQRALGKHNYLRKSHCWTTTCGTPPDPHPLCESDVPQNGDQEPCRHP